MNSVAQCAHVRLVTALMGRSPSVADWSGWSPVGKSRKSPAMVCREALRLVEVAVRSVVRERLSRESASWQLTIRFDEGAYMNGIVL